LYNPEGHQAFDHRPIWATNTHGMDENPTLVLMNNGNLGLFGQTSTLIWSSNSHHGGPEPAHSEHLKHWLRKKDYLRQGQVLHAG